MSVTTVRTAVGEGSAVETPPQDRAWVWYITSLSVVLGLLLGLALRSQWQIRQLQLPANRFSTLAAAYGDLKKGNDELQTEVKKLRERTTQLETRLSEGTFATETLNRQLQDVKFLAGWTPVRGPGLVIKLQDSPLKLPRDVDPQQMIVHDEDINAIVNELKAAGAEAIAIAGAGAQAESISNADPSRAQRVSALTTARCAGPGTKVNDTVFGAPYYVFAIGNPADLESQLKIPNGVVDRAMLEPLKMIQIERRAEMSLPAYTGSMHFRFAKKAE
jgi:uncharacterized protein YlxW (UPF0749 family)